MTGADGMQDRVLRVALVGAGMFGGDVHLRTYAQLQRNGLLPWLGRLGLDDKARLLGDLRVEFVALATNTEASGRARREECRAKHGLDFPVYHGETPWMDVLRDFPDLDILAVATPDHLHTAPILAALERGVHVITEKGCGCEYAKEAPEKFHGVSSCFDPDTGDAVEAQPRKSSFSSAFGAAVNELADKRGLPVLVEEVRRRLPDRLDEMSRVIRGYDGCASLVQCLEERW